MDYIPKFEGSYLKVSRAGVIAMAGGLHASELSQGTVNSIYNRWPGKARHYIFATLWAPGVSSTPAKYLKRFGDEATLNYNKMVMKSAAQKGATVLDA